MSDPYYMAFQIVFVMGASVFVVALSVAMYVAVGRLRQKRLILQKIEALRCARARVDRGSARTVCGALIHVEMKHSALTKASTELRSYISAQLGGSTTLQSWLLTKGHITPEDLFNYPDHMRVTRLAWIDWMVEQLEAQL